MDGCCGEMTHHLGYKEGEEAVVKVPIPQWTSTKTLQTDNVVTINIPRDRSAILIRYRAENQRRLPDSMTGDRAVCEGLSTKDIQGYHLRDLQTEVPGTHIHRYPGSFGRTGSGKIAPGKHYPIVYLDGIRVKSAIQAYSDENSYVPLHRYGRQQGCLGLWSPKPRAVNSGGHHDRT